MKKMIAAFLIIAATQLAAMEIRKFDKMDDRGQSRYIGDMIVAAEQILTDKGKRDVAAQVKHLFTTKQAGDADTSWDGGIREASGDNASP